MGTVLDYLKAYGDISFREKSMCEVDALALCQLSYLKFDGLVPGMRENASSVTLASLKNHPDYEKIYADVRYSEVNHKLIEGMLSGCRFRNLKLNCYVNDVEKERETQFSAITYLLEDGTIFIAFRGTDESIVGWKEDFNMAFQAPVPGQENAVRYVNNIASRFKSSFYVGGHSKGGNFAVYSAMNCKPNLQERIRKVFSLDGPGFRPEVLEKCNTGILKSRLVKILPVSSLIGMLFGSDKEYRVVKSKNMGIGQHDPYSWLVEEDHLVYADDVYEGVRKRNEALNAWILSLSEEQVRVFVDTLFGVLAASESDNLIDMTGQWKRSMNGMLAALKGVDSETAKVIRQVIGALFEIMGESMAQDFVKNVKNAGIAFLK